MLIKRGDAEIITVINNGNAELDEEATRVALADAKKVQTQKTAKTTQKALEK